MRKYQQLLLRA